MRETVDVLDSEPAPRLGEDWQLVEAMLPDGWMEKARTLRAFQRARGIADPRALLRVMLIHLAHGYGLRDTAAHAELAGLAQVSDVALLKRLRSCAAWFEWLARELRKSPELRGADDEVARASLLGGRRLRAVDGSIVREPGSTGSQWRLHYAIGLPHLNCEEVHVGPSTDGETLRRFTVSRGDVLLADRGYCHPPGIAYVQSKGGDVIVRINLVALPLSTPEGDKLDVLQCVRALSVGQVGSWPVVVNAPAAHRISGRLCAVRKSVTAAEKAKKRARKDSADGGHKVKPETLEAAEFILVFTTLAEDVAPEQVLELYRLRWQIELEFKRLKSLIQLGHLKKHDEQSARSWLQGKLLVAVLIARLIAHAERVSPWGYEFSWVRDEPTALPVA